MTRALIVFVCLFPTSAWAQVAGNNTVNGNQVSLSSVCRKAHQDAAVNNTVTLTLPTPSTSSLTTCICGWDWQSVQDGTATAQSNVKWATTNFGNPVVSQQYSMSANPNALTSGTFMPAFLVAVDNPSLPFVIASPAAATHVAYSVNVYYTFCPVVQ